MHGQLSCEFTLVYIMKMEVMEVNKSKGCETVFTRVALIPILGNSHVKNDVASRTYL